MEQVLESVSLKRLRTSVRGEVIDAGDHRYEAARRLFYTGFDGRPAAVVRPADAEDVAAVVVFCGETGTTLAVRGGGHSLAGHSVCDDGIVLDLSSLDELEIDTAARTAWAGGGVTAGAYTAETGHHGLATGFGDTPSVGIAGITLGGGVGFLHRKHGLTVDNLLAAEIVTADGRILELDEEHHPDLFWAIRGGGGNFGVVTRLRLKLHEVDQVLGGMLILPATPEIVAECVAVAESAPEELSGLINVAQAPAMPMIPAEHHGRPIIMAMLTWAGDPAGGEEVFSRLRGLVTPLADMIRPMRYPEMYAGHENAPHPVAVTARPGFVDRFDSDSANLVLEGLWEGTAPMRVVQLRVLGGAVARVPAEATAFAHRTRRILTVVAAACDDTTELPRHAAWAGSLLDALPHRAPGAYVGFLAEADSSRVREAYPHPTWERLVEVKRRYDPRNLFRRNQNVRG